MNKKIFNTLLVGVMLALFAVASAVKIYSVLSFPEIIDWNYHQLQKINRVEKDKFSFIVFGDNKNSARTFENIIEKVNKEDAIFAIDVGDLVYDGEREKYRFFINQIKKFNIPLLTVIGNHDIREGGRANYYELFGKFYYSFTVGNSYFIILDDSNEKNLNPEQMDWLRNELQKSQNYKYLFIFMHVPLYDPRKSNNKTGHGLKNKAFANELNDLFDKNKITMLFVSHIHAYYRGIWGETPYIITGGAGAELVGSDPRHYFYHYIKVNVSERGIECKVIRVKSPDFEILDRWAHNAWIYIYSFFAIHFLDSIIIIALIYLGFYIVFIRKEWLIWNLGKKKR